MGDKHLVVLRAMSTIAHSTDMDEFLRMVELTMAELVETLKLLAQDGFVTKTGKGYTIADKGKLALTALSALPKKKAFTFYLRIGEPAGVSARSIKEFYDVVKNVEVTSLEFHLEREDFENWIKNSAKDDVFAGELAHLRQDGLKGEALRKQMLIVLQERFGEDVLSREWAA